MSVIDEIKIKQHVRIGWLLLNFLVKLCELSCVFLIPRDNSIYIGKNAIGVMSKMGFE